MIRIKLDVFQKSTLCFKIILFSASGSGEQMHVLFCWVLQSWIGVCDLSFLADMYSVFLLFCSTGTVRVMTAQLSKQTTVKINDIAVNSASTKLTYELSHELTHKRISTHLCS